MKLRKLLRKQKFLLHIIVIIVGAMLIGWGYFIYRSAYPKDSEDFHPNAEAQYDILVGIGGGFASSAIVTILLLAVLPDESEESQRLREWGIRTVYEERSKVEIRLENRRPSAHLDFIAFGLSHFVGKNMDHDAIAGKIQKGLMIRIITLNPYSSYVADREKLEKNNIQSDIMRLIKWVDAVNRCVKQRGESVNQIQIQFYNGLPLEFYCRADDKVYVGPYIPDTLSGSTVTYMLDYNSEGGQWYSELFERIWTGKSNVELSRECRKLYYVDQGKAIRSVMEFFCKSISEEKNMGTVVGVVVIFKGEKRRTFFSCNKKHPDRHRIHEKGEGTVGLLMKALTEGGSETMIVFNDYQNELAFVQKIQRRKETRRLMQTAVKLKNNDDTAAVLAIPLKNEDGIIIGALTFDFVELPKDYQAIVESVKNSPRASKMVNEEPLNDLFDKIIQCGAIVENLLGQQMKTEYEKLFEEEW